MKYQKLFGLLTICALLVALVPGASGATQAQPRADYELPFRAAPELLTGNDGAVAGDLRHQATSETASVWLLLEDEPVLAFEKANGPMSLAAKQSYREALDAKQNVVAGQAEALGAVELARLNYLLNLVAVKAPANRLDALRALPGVAGVYPVVDGEVQLEHSAERIGARYAQDVLGLDGSGLTVGIIDSGVDYTHAAFGGPGTALAYTIATSGTNAAVITDTFAPGWVWPTDTIKVVGGYDFTGPDWDRGVDETLSPDPDPIDDGPAAGHGTNVASIAAGWEVVSGTETLVYAGIAPGADIYAYKVCSSHSTACSGIAMVQGIEQAVMDGVDVINMSIGSDYGVNANDVHDMAMDAAADAGVLIAVAAGNAGDLPYIAGSPSTAKGVLSVAASFAVGQNNPGLHVDAPDLITDTTYLAFDFGWAPDPAEDIVAPMTYVGGEGCSVDDYTPGLVVTDTIALILRGNCNFDLKVQNAEQMGAVAAVIFTANPGDAPFSGGGSPIVNIPAIMIGNPDGVAIRDAIAAGPVTGTLGPGVVYPLPELEDAIVDYSSRGPTFYDNSLKPQITAPGPGVYSADVGSGNQASLFGGTSSASPHVAGTLLLMREAFPTWPVERIYNALMNNTFTELYLQEDGGNPNYGGTGTRAPVARQGAGLVQVHEALESTTVAWEDSSDIAALSFGFDYVSDTYVMTKTVRIQNNRETGTPGMYRNYHVTFDNIFADDVGAGVTVEIDPTYIGIPDGTSGTVDVILHADAADLKEWPTNSGGAWGGTGALLTDLEFDGYLTVEETWAGTGMPVQDEITLPLHFLPHKAADVMAEATTINLASYADTAALTLTNSAAYTGTADVYAWMIDDPADVVTGYLDIDQVGVVAYNSQYGPMIEFVATTEGSRAHQVVAEVEFAIDTNNDQVPDYYVWNTDYFGDGSSIVLVYSMETGLSGPYFYADTELNGKTTRLPVLAFQLGLDATNLAFNLQVSTYENYYFEDYFDYAPDTGWVSYDGNNPQFYTAPGWADVLGSEVMDVYAMETGYFRSPDQMGLLILYRHQEMEAETVQVNVADMGASDCPDDGRTDVGARESLTVLFSAPVTGTVEFKLRPYPAGTGTLEFPVDVAWDAGATTATITPQSPLMLGAGYELSHAGGMGEGGEVFAPNAWTFFVGKLDTYLPIILHY